MNEFVIVYLLYMLIILYAIIVYAIKLYACLYYNMFIHYVYNIKISMSRNSALSRISACSALFLDKGHMSRNHAVEE